jgi:WS/DGAT/MGAT family acyltransferase
MWELEAEPRLSTAFANLSIFSSVPDVARLQRRMDYVSAKVPRFRLRLDPADQRRWQPYRDFDVTQHVRQVSLDSPGTDQQLFELAMKLFREPFDTSRPLWDFVIIDGLGGGRGAMLQKLHHIVTDGEGGLRFAELMVDLEPNAPEPEPVRPSELVVPDAPSFIDEAFSTVTGTAAGILRQLSRPTELPGLGIEGALTAKGLLEKLVATADQGSPELRSRGGDLAFSTLQLDFDDAKGAAGELNASLNDVFVAVVVRAMASYQERLDRRPSSVHVAVPLSTRRSDSAAANSFVPVRVDIAVKDDMVDQVAAVSERMNRTKADPSLDVVDSVAGLLSRMPGAALRQLVKVQASAIDIVASNVRGAPVDLWFAGAKMTGNFPIGPLSGTPANLTMMSNCGNLDLGLVCDTAAVSQPKKLRNDLDAAWEDLLQL